MLYFFLLLKYYCHRAKQVGSAFSLLNELLKRDFVFFDNAIGWLLLKSGLKAGQRPDIMNITAPDAVESLQRKTCEAGSDIICTNTFGANAKTLKGTGYTVEEVISAAVCITKRAGMGKSLTALDIGPIGELISPFGTLTPDEAYELYRAQAVAGEAAGADLAVIETMSDLAEVKAAMLAVKENTKLPVFAMMTFDKSGRTFTGCRPESFAITAEGLGAAAVGINCSLSPNEIFPIAEKIAISTSLPIIVKPNAGLPNSVTGAYDIDAREFARQMERFAAMGVKIVGGCCGTTAEYIKELRCAFDSLKPAAVDRDKGLRICTSMRVERLEGYDCRETGKSAAMSSEDIVDDALDQADSGESILTVRLPDGFMPEDAADVVRSIQSQSDRPLCLVSNDLPVLSRALRDVAGTAAVRCPRGDRKALADMALKYGAAVI